MNSAGRTTTSIAKEIFTANKMDVGWYPQTFINAIM